MVRARQLEFDKFYTLWCICLIIIFPNAKLAFYIYRLNFFDVIYFESISLPFCIINNIRIDDRIFLV